MWAVISHLSALIVCTWGALKVIDFVVWWIKDEIDKKKSKK